MNRDPAIDVRPTAPGELRAAADAMAAALLSPPATDEQWHERAPGWESSHSFSAWQGDRCVGHAAYFDIETVVPGGRVRSGAVSRVGVLATHRRRGIATRLLQQVLDDAAARGLTLLSLRASEAMIYERYGYGIAGDVVDTEVIPARARPLVTPTSSGTVRLLRTDEILSVVPDLYARIAMRRHGAITRPATWWKRILDSATSGKRAGFVAVHADATGELDGYVHYDAEWNDDRDANRADGPSGRGEIHDLFGATDEVELELWRYVLDVDLVSRWVGDERPIDDVLRRAVRDPRSVRVMSLIDEQWVRLVDVDAALRSRAYRPATRPVTIGVRDTQRPANDGVWTIAADGTVGDGPTDEREPDLQAPIAALSAAYLGGVSWSTLVSTGRVAANDPTAVAAADELWSTSTAPYCGTFF